MNKNKVLLIFTSLALLLASVGCRLAAFPGAAQRAKYLTDRSVVSIVLGSSLCGRIVLVKADGQILFNGKVGFKPTADYAEVLEKRCPTILLLHVEIDGVVSEGSFRMIDGREISIDFHRQTVLLVQRPIPTVFD
jgi:hypothetical protein